MLQERDSAQDVARGATDAQLPLPGTFTIPPSQAVIDALIAHVRATGAPETFPSITTTTPPKDSVVRFIKRIPTIDRSKRFDKQEAPCPICSPNAPKFIKNGILAWYPDEGAIRVIGPECGDRIFGGSQYSIALAELKKQEREAWLVEFIRLNLPKQTSILAALNVLEEPVIEAQRLYKAFRQSVPRVFARLRDIKKQGGALRVSIVRELCGCADDDDIRIIGPRGITTRESDYEVIEELIGFLPDTTALNTNFDPVSELRKHRQSLLGLPQLVSGDEAFLWACDQSEGITRFGGSCKKAQQMCLWLLEAC